MKKLFPKLLLIALFLGNLVCIDSQAGSAQKLRIVWGKRSKDCHGFGICDMYITFVLADGAAVRLADDQRTLVLDVSEASVKGYETDFSGPTISIEEPFDVPAEVLKTIGSSSPFLISAGTYKLEKTKFGYTIYFTK